MILYRHTLGTGCPLLALHGWGLHSGVWSEVQQALSVRYRVTVLDLPGYGRSPALPEPWGLTELSQAVLTMVREPMVWMGWSLGGMIALAAARHQPEKVRALVLVASTPCFVQKVNWPHGLASTTLQAFAESLEQDPEMTLRRFLTLQAGPGEAARFVAKRLRGELRRHGLPRREVVRGGLAILRDTDLRDTLSEVGCPTLLVLGARDTLVPAAVGQAVVELCPGWQIVILPKSAHAPFISHPSEFLARLKTFLNEMC